MTETAPPATVTDPCRLPWGWEHDGRGQVCGEPSTAVLSTACRHEHVDTGIRICWPCAADVQQAAGLLACVHCREGRRPHICYLLVVIEWDSGEKTIVQEADRG